MKADSILLGDNLRCPKCKRVLTSYRGEGRNHYFCPNGSCPVRKVVVIWQGVKPKHDEERREMKVAMPEESAKRRIARQ